MVPARLAPAVNVPKYQRVAANIRAQIADGMLIPGQPAPSGAALSRITGYSALTCRKALRILVRDGVLVPGTSPNARPRVPVPATPSEQIRADAIRALSKALAVRRRAARLTQPELAEIIGMSVTTVGHAETGRLWQGRHFWELVDKALSAGGELLALHDAYRAATVPAEQSAPAKNVKAKTTANIPPTAAVAVSGPVTRVTITWANGEVTTVYPPNTPRGQQAPLRPTVRAGKLPRSLLRQGTRRAKRADPHRPGVGFLALHQHHRRCNTRRNRQPRRGNHRQRQASAPVPRLT
jgi:hypothetical protein